MQQFAQGELPAPRDLIADGDEYLLLNGFLSEDATFASIDSGVAFLRRKGGGLELNGAPVVGGSVRFRAIRSAR